MSQAPLPAAYFSNLLPELATRAARATVSRLGFSNPALRQYLNERFSVGLGEPGCFIGEPVFEATFGWQTADKTLGALAPDLLSPRLVDALTGIRTTVSRVTPSLTDTSWKRGSCLPGRSHSRLS